MLYQYVEHLSIGQFLCLLQTIEVSNMTSCDRELYSNNISGIIPSELGNLTNLVSLDLYLNNFTGQIPDSLGNLSKLRFL